MIQESASSGSPTWLILYGVISTVVVSFIGWLIRLLVDATKKLGETSKRMDRLLGVLPDFPPHRHINGNITYPHGFDPPLVEHSMAMAARTGDDY